MIYIIFLVYCVYQYFIIRHIETNGQSHYGDERIVIYDIFHNNLPNMYEYKYINDIITMMILLPLLTNFDMLNEYLGYWIVIFFIRSIANIVTILPKNEKCDISNIKSLGCYDKIFSGHFASVLLACLVYLKYGIIDTSLLVLICIIQAISILLCQTHYTIDILVAIFVTLMVYQNNLSLYRQ
jgi:hypothetical protein